MMTIANVLPAVKNTKRPTHYHPLLTKEQQLTSIVHKILPKQAADSLSPKGLRLARLYGLPKTHKPVPSTRPILSAAETYNFKLAKWLDENLRGEKLTYKSVAKEILKPPFLELLKSNGHQSLLCLFDSRFLQMFRTTPIFGMSRDHNRKRLKTRTEWIVFEM